MENQSPRSILRKTTKTQPKLNKTAIAVLIIQALKESNKTTSDSVIIICSNKEARTNLESSLVIHYPKLQAKDFDPIDTNNLLISKEGVEHILSEYKKERKAQLYKQPSALEKI